MKFNFRLAIFAIAIAFGIVFSIPSLLQTKDGKKITLGLDLQGGLHMLLGVKTDEAVKSHIKSITATIKHFSDKNDILIDELKFDDESISFTVLDSDELPKVQKFLHDVDGAVVSTNGETISFKLTQKEIEKIKKEAIAQAIETIRNRLDQFGLAEPIVALQGKDKILVELAGIKTQEEEQRARELISRTAKLELMAVDEDRDARVLSMTQDEASEYGDLILQDSKIQLENI